MQGFKDFGEESSDLLQAISLKDIWVLVPGGGDQEPVSLKTASFTSGTVHHLRSSSLGGDRRLYIRNTCVCNN